MDDLLNRLRAVDPPGGNEHSTRWHRNPDGPEAADRIEALEAEVERLQARERELEAALRPFAAADAWNWETTVFGQDDDSVVNYNHATGEGITRGDFGRAARALAAVSAETEDNNDK